MKFQLLFLMVLIYCSNVQSKTYPLVFVHGAHFSADSFAPLANFFSNTKTYLVDLPNDPATALKVTLTDYSKKVCQVLKTIPGKAVVIGHSQGGAVINHAFGICPEKFKAFIYVAATIPFPGEKPFELFGAQDDEYYFKAISEDKERGVFAIVNKDAFVNAFIHDGTDDQKIFALKASQDEPIRPSSNIVSFDMDKYTEIEKILLMTLEDRVISLETQKKYADRLQKVTIRTIHSGHLPMVVKQKEIFAEISGFLERL